VSEDQAGETIKIVVPGTIKVRLPYSPRLGDIWYAESGGAGVAVADGSTFDRRHSIQELKFTLAEKLTSPLVLLYLPGEHTGASPLKRFIVILQGV